MKLKIWYEIIWWAIAAVVAAAVIYPILRVMRVWEFQTLNIVFVVGLVTLSRLIFLFPHTPWATRQPVKVALLLLCFPATFFLYDFVNRFVVHINQVGWEYITGHLPTAQKASMESYIWNEMLFFGVGCVIATPVLAGRLMLSIWRQHNRGTL